MPEPGHLRQESGEGETKPWPDMRIEATKYEQYRCENPACKTLWLRVETENGEFLEWVPVPWCARSIAAKGGRKDAARMKTPAINTLGKRGAKAVLP